MNTQNALKKLLAATLLTTILGLSAFYDLPEAQAAQTSAIAGGLSCLSGVLGIKIPGPKSLFGKLGASQVPVDSSQANKDACKTFVNRLSDLAAATARQVLKKRILDAIVDQTINWINGNGNPKFVTDFDGFLKDSAQAAVGDVANEVGAGALCEPFKFRLQVDLQQRGPFSQQVSCTLDKIVGNIDAFYDNFSNGGWAGYSEILKPQNNYYGAFLLAQDEAIKRTSIRTQANALEVRVGSGFLSTKQCLEWEASGKDDSGNSVSKKFPFNYNGWNQPYPDPSKKPPVLVTGINNLNWTCSQQKISTPGQLLAGATQKAVNAHTDYIINADDISEYFAAIIDAGLNRLIKEGVKGLSGLTSSSQNVPAQGYFSAGNIPENVSNAAADYSKARTDQQVGSEINDFRNNLNEASSSLNAARINLSSVLDLNNELVSSTEELVSWCGANGGSFSHPVACSNLSLVLSGTVLRASTTLLQINTVSGLTLLLSSFQAQAAVVNISNLSSLTEAFIPLSNQIDSAASAAENLFSETQSLLTTIQTTLLSCTSGGDCDAQ